jgi:AcrR family transcriptional regulator
MPKETFFNLPEEKRKLITNIAIEEFANHDYGNVSISRMVARAEIAKGSFYQYFEDKEDLYSYLLDLCMQAKFEVLGLDRPDPEHVGIFRYLLWTAQAGIKLQLLYPDLVKIAYRALHSNSYPAKFWKRAMDETHKFSLHLVAIGKAQGDIAPEIDNDLAAFLFDTVFSNLGQYLLPYITQYQESPPQGDTFFAAEVVAIFEQTLSILQYGMGKARPPQIEGQYSKWLPNTSGADKDKASTKENGQEAVKAEEVSS